MSRISRRSKNDCPPMSNVTDVPPAQLGLEQSRLLVGAKEDGDVARPNPPDSKSRRRPRSTSSASVVHRHTGMKRTLPSPAGGIQAFFVPARVVCGQPVGQFENGGVGAVILLQPDDFRLRKDALEIPKCAGTSAPASRKSTGRRLRRRRSNGVGAPGPRRGRTGSRSCPGTRRSARDRSGDLVARRGPRGNRGTARAVNSNRSSKSTPPRLSKVC